MSCYDAADELQRRRFWMRKRRQWKKKCEYLKVCWQRQISFYRCCQLID